MSQEASTNVVVDDGRTKLSDFWKKEDYWAIWLGFAVIIVAYYLFIWSVPQEKVAEYSSAISKADQIMEEEGKVPFSTIEWINANSAQKKPKSADLPAGKTVAKYMKRPAGWSSNPLDAFFLSDSAAKAISEGAKAKADETAAKAATSLAAAKTAQEAAKLAAYGDAELNKAAKTAIDTWVKDSSAASKAKSKAGTKPFSILTTLPVMMLIFMAMFGIGIFFMGQSVPRFAVGFIGVFLLAVISFMMGSQATMKQYGVGSEAWAIALGMLVANTIGTPKWVKPALQTEFYIKTGLVCLGAEVLFDKIIAIGIPGIFVAWVVTPTVLITTFIFGQKVLKIESKTLNMTISADMSVCGTSAAIATAAACRAKKEELTLAIGISLIFTAIMMIAMPAFIKAVGLYNFDAGGAIPGAGEILGGAWIGGTVDATGAVAAAGAFLGQKALYVAATIKMIQNVLIGVTAFGVAIYWVTKVDRKPNQNIRAMEIWDRFPKFVLGFLTASIVTSLISGSLGAGADAMVSRGVVRGLTSPMRTWCFGLAFSSIGLATNFRELAKYFKGGKPVILYVCGQSFNLCLTLAMAYFMFIIVFPEITKSI